MRKSFLNTPSKDPRSRSTCLLQVPPNENDQLLIQGPEFPNGPPTSALHPFAGFGKPESSVAILGESASTRENRRLCSSCTLLVRPPPTSEVGTAPGRAVFFDLFSGFLLADNRPDQATMFGALPVGSRQ
jgi:hypothetical protein